MTEIQLGQTVYLKPYGNASYYPGHKKSVTGTITKIGRQYFYVSLYGTVEKPDERPIKFDKATLECRHEDCNAGYDLFLTEEDMLKSIEQARMRTKITYFIRNYDGRMSYDVLKQIYDILIDAGLISDEDDTIRTRG